jgi:hypothetical protein
MSGALVHFPDSPLTEAERRRGYNRGVGPLRITTWNDWYRFARDRLRLRHEQAAAYADTRFADEMGRKAQGISLSAPPPAGLG